MVIQVVLPHICHTIRNTTQSTSTSITFLPTSDFALKPLLSTSWIIQNYINNSCQSNSDYITLPTLFSNKDRQNQLTHLLGELKRHHTFTVRQHVHSHLTQQRPLRPTMEQTSLTESELQNPCRTGDNRTRTISSQRNLWPGENIPHSMLGVWRDSSHRQLTFLLFFLTKFLFKQKENRFGLFSFSLLICVHSYRVLIFL